MPSVRSGNSSSIVSNIVGHPKTRSFHSMQPLPTANDHIGTTIQKQITSAEAARTHTQAQAQAGEAMESEAGQS